MNDLVYEYVPPKNDVTRHMWTAVGDNGGVHIWAEPTPEGFRWGEKFYGGIEVHSKTRLYEFGDGSPDHDTCWLLGCPCWHDGSSLYFSERIEPILRSERAPFNNAVNGYMNAILFDWYQSRFGLKAEEV